MTPQGPIDCPVCKMPMAQFTIGEVTIDRCPNCHGIWLDSLEKEKLLEQPSAARAADPGATGYIHRPAELGAPSRLLCPRDRSRLIGMADIQQPHVKFDWCLVCGGGFLNAGELTDLSEYTLRERMQNFFRKRTP